MTELTRIQIAPYAREIHDTIDSALYRLGLLEQEGRACVDLGDALRASSEQDRELDEQAFNAKLQSQAKIFDLLDAFLSNYARLSLLIFPSSKDAFALERAATLQRCFALEQTSPLNNRDLRDSWVHFDERIDQALQAKRATNGQTFCRSAQVDDRVKETYLRIIEIDTLRIHFRNRQGQSAFAALRELRGPMLDIEKRRSTAFDNLRSGIESSK